MEKINSTNHRINAADEMLSNLTASAQESADSKQTNSEENNVFTSFLEKVKVEPQLTQNSVIVKKRDQAWRVDKTPSQFFHLAPNWVPFHAKFYKDKRHNDKLYIVSNDLHEHPTLVSLLATYKVLRYATPSGYEGLWALRICSADGRTDGYIDSSVEAAKLAEKSWVRVQANLEAERFDIFQALGDLGEPVFSDLQQSEILSLSFKDCLIDSAEHPVIKELEGR